MQEKNSILEPYETNIFDHYLYTALFISSVMLSKKSSSWAWLSVRKQHFMQYFLESLTLQSPSFSFLLFVSEG